jgi:hypothetical protein
MIQKEQPNASDSLLAGIINTSKAIGTWLKSEKPKQETETRPDRIPVGFVFLL